MHEKGDRCEKQYSPESPGMIVCVHGLGPSLVLEQQDCANNRLVGRVEIGNIGASVLNINLSIRIEPNPEGE